MATVIETRLMKLCISLFLKHITSQAQYLVILYIYSIRYYRKGIFIKGSIILQTAQDILTKCWCKFKIYNANKFGKYLNMYRNLGK